MRKKKNNMNGVRAGGCAFIVTLRSQRVESSILGFASRLICRIYYNVLSVVVGGALQCELRIVENRFVCTIFA